MRVASGQKSLLNEYSRISTFRQDPSVSEPGESQLPKDTVGRRLEGPRVAIAVGRGERRAYPNKDGDYLFGPNNPRFDQGQAFVSAQNTLDLFQGYAEREISWAFDRPELAVVPHAGEGKNAYYARWAKAVSFYSFDSPHLGKRVHTAQSADVVSHETGHALLDGLKPEYGKTFDKETKAMHEAFGDCAAMLLTISRPENRADALAETGGDLRQDNCIARIAEEFGAAVRLANRNPNDDHPYLRNANNTFQYVPPETLPKDGPRDTLSAESHSFCQIFTRAFYNGIVNSYDQGRLEGLDSDQALARAGDRMGRVLAQGMTMAAPNRARFQDVALAMLRADRFKGGQEHRSLSTAFLESHILKPEDLETLNTPLPQGTPDEILSQLNLSDYQLSRSVTDRNGRTTQEYLLSEERPVHGLAAWNGFGLTADVTGGVSLTFESSGELVHLAHLAPDPESEFAGIPAPQILWGPQSGPASARLITGPKGQKIERLPVWD